MNEQVLTSLQSHGFKVLELVGSGSYASVYTVEWDSYPNQIFAAKIISVEGGRKQSSLISYENEIHTLSHLFHKNIIKVYKHFPVGDCIVIIIEYCCNKTLQNFIKSRGNLKFDVFKHIAKECLEAVDFCHKNKIIHRDIKPSNIAFGSNFNIKLFDFGLADMVKDEKLDRYDGSLCYKAPELFDKEPYDPMKADIWALGITFYYCLYGDIPWDCRTYDNLVLQISFKNIMFPTDENPEIKSLIRKMTSKDPEERPSASELLELPLFQTNSSSSLKKINSYYSEFSQIQPINLKKPVMLTRGYTCRISHSTSLCQKTFK